MLVGAAAVIDTPDHVLLGPLELVCFFCFVVVLFFWRLWKDLELCCGLGKLLSAVERA